MLKVEFENPVECRVNKKMADLILPCMTYKKEFWKKGQYRKIRQEYQKQVFHSKGKIDWFFYSGFLPRIETYCRNNDIKMEIENNSFRFLTTEPYVAGFTLRPDQNMLIRKARKYQRGVLKAPTGTGKTIVMLGIISSFPNNAKVLILADKQGLVTQTSNALTRVGYKDVQQIYGGQDRKFKSRIVVSTMQSFVKIPPQQFATYFDMVIVDEAHHISKFDGTYAKILEQLMAPARFGFTATLPTNAEAILALEGLLGPTIGEVTIEQARQLGILAKPVIKLIKSSFSYKIADLRVYSDVYRMGVTSNKQRNKRIIQEIKDYSIQNKSVLVVVNQIEHGEILFRMGKEADLKIHFVQGEMNHEHREIVKKELEEKTIDCAIATTVWKEGINIPSLDVVINAAGGKSEINTLQSIGRGLRKTTKKDQVIVVDFFDPSSRYLISHFGERISLYFEMGWMGEEAMDTNGCDTIKEN